MFQAEETLCAKGFLAGGSVVCSRCRMKASEAGLRRMMGNLVSEWVEGRVDTSTCSLCAS